MLPSSKPFLLFFTGVVALLPSLVSSQSAAPNTGGQTVFKASARTVVVDVVVTDRKGKPVERLPQADFMVEEDGKPQPITSFEEHTGEQPVQANLPDLPPNIFTNIPRVKPTDAVTVLLLDGLNTELQDQSVVRRQMLKYVSGLQPGRRVAIFALGTRLTFIQGFTDDPALLAAALKDVKRGAAPQRSAVLQSHEEIAADQKTTTAMAEHAYAAAVALQQFQAEQQASQTSLRVDMTLTAFQELANYLSGIPGRKNVVWFSSAFPSVLFGNSDLSDSFAVQGAFGDQIRKTDTLLAGAQMAIYPVAVEGLSTGSLYDADQQFGAVVSGQVATQPPPISGTLPGQQGTPLAQQATTQQNNAIKADAIQRNANHTTMDDIARETGGAAFYNTNGLNDALAKVVDHGSYFYTLSYTPADAISDGRLRKIQVKLTGSGESYKLAYRRGYFAPDAKALQAASVQAAAKPAGDPLFPYMKPGMPDSTQIPLAFRVLRTSAPTGTDPAQHTANQADASARAGDNPNLKGPLNRYAVAFVVAGNSLHLDTAPDGSRHGKIEATMVIYDDHGKALNWMVRQRDVDMSAARYAQVQQNGFNFSMDIDAPESAATLRGGVYDFSSNLAGTLEIPLSSLSPTQTANAGSK